MKKVTYKPTLNSVKAKFLDYYVNLQKSEDYVKSLEDNTAFFDDFKTIIVPTITFPDVELKNKWFLTIIDNYTKDDIFRIVHTDFAEIRNV